MPSSSKPPESADSKDAATANTKVEDVVDDNDADDDDEDVDIVNINVGVLGHVDSGKTSLVKALSTLLSTAALDKSQQSRQRGMTLDLGFSCFFLNQVPSQIVAAKIALAKQQQQQLQTTTTNNKQQQQQQQRKNNKKQLVQITLVDCPGHASLIRTIIGAAQIIDMVLLVVDAVKGWQAQTTECLVLAELLPRASSNSLSLVVALNKTDAILPISERPAKLEKAKHDVWERLKTTRYANAPIVGVAACVGGEKVAAITSNSSTNNTSSSKATTTTTTTTTTSPENTTTALASAPLSTANETYNLPELIRVLSESLPVPKRLLQQQQQQQKPTSDNKNASSSSASPFYFSIDHCFSIRGRGTVLTGTVLRGSVQLNQVLEFPTLGRMERKVKSMQMFQRSVTLANTGDRVGICVTSLDAKLLERGMAAQPGSIPLLSAVLALVRKVPYYASGPLMSGSKFHVSVGHTTVMATVTFWGARELLAAATSRQLQQETSNDDDLPSIQYDFTQEFIQQDRLLDTLQDDDNSKTDNDDNNDDDHDKQSCNKQENGGLLQWALLDLATPIYCPLDSLVIGSRLDLAATNESSTVAPPSAPATTSTSNNTSSCQSSTTCRLAFSGRLLTPLDDSNSSNPADKNSNSNNNALSRIRLYNYKERRGVICKLGDAHRRSDDGKTVRYEVFGSDLFKKETNMKAFIGMKVQVETNTSGGSSKQQKNKKQQEGGTAGSTTTTTATTTTISEQAMLPKGPVGGRGGDVGEIKSSYGTDGKFRVFFPAGTEAKEGDVLVLKFQRFVHDKAKAMHQSNAFLKLAPARPGTRIEKEKKIKNKQAAAAAVPSLPAGVKATGEVVSVKGDVVVVVAEDDANKKNGVKKQNMAIVSGFFEPHVNIKEHLYQVKIPSTGEQGTIVGPFGKAGKVKVSFPQGISESAVGSKAELQIKPK